MTAQTIIPRLPVELMGEIITVAWHMPLSSPERITFMRSSILVNSTWADIFDLISSRDVYIPSSLYSEHFIRRLRAKPPVTSVPSPSSSFLGSFFRLFEQAPIQARSANLPVQARSANLACRSLTIQIPNVNVHPDQHNRLHLPMGSVLDELLETLDVQSLAPNLRRLSIEYLDAGFDDVFEREGPAAMAEQITHLELHYSFSETTPSWLAKSLQEKQEMRRHLKWSAKSVTNLSIFGAGQNTIRDALTACPNTQVLEVDTSAGRFEVPTVLVLR